MLYKIILAAPNNWNGMKPGGNDAAMLQTNKWNPMLAANSKKNISPTLQTNLSNEFLNEMNNRVWNKCHNLDQQPLEEKLDRAICNFLIEKLNKLLRSASKGNKVYLGLTKYTSKRNLKLSKGHYLFRNIS